MKTYPLLSLLLVLTLQSAPPTVVSIDVPDVDTSFYGFNAVLAVVVYDKASPEDLAVDPESIGIDDLEVTLTTASPEFSYMTGMRLQVRSAMAEVVGNTIVVKYGLSPYNPGWNPRYSGTYTITLKANQVGTVPHPKTSVVEYAPEAELATFTAAVADVRAEVKGRIWNDTGVEASFVDEGFAIDPGISDWNIYVDRWDVEAEFWTTATDYADYNYTYITKWDGAFIIRYLPPGDYRIYALDLPVEISEQALGDPTRGGVLDGYYHFSIQPEDDGSSQTVNLVYREESASPYTEHDTFEIGWKTVDVRLDVLANDSVDPPLTHEDLRIVGLNGRPSAMDNWEMASTGSWGGAIRSDGRFVYYTPPSPDFWGREIEFAYRISDGQGNFDIERAWVKVLKTPTNPFEAVDDIVEVANHLQTYEIFVLNNDVIFPPHEYEEVTVSVDPTSSIGAHLEVIDGKRVLYEVSYKYVGSDTFSYTMESPLGDIRTAEVRVRLGPEGIQNDPFAGRNKAIEALLMESLEGRQFLYFYRRFVAEMFRILSENAPAEYLSQRGTTRESITVPPLEVYFPALNGDFSQVFLGDGETTMISWEAVDELKAVTTLFKTVGSPELRLAVEEQEAMVPGGWDGLYGQPMAELFQAFGVDPGAIRVQVHDPRLQSDVFSMKTPNVIGQDIALWKNASLDSDGWVEVTDAVQLVEEPYILVTDPNPDPVRTFYKIEASAETP